MQLPTHPVYQFCAGLIRGQYGSYFTDTVLSADTPVPHCHGVTDQIDEDPQLVETRTTFPSRVIGLVEVAGCSRYHVRTQTLLDEFISGRSPEPVAADRASLCLRQDFIVVEHDHLSHYTQLPLHLGH